MAGGPMASELLSTKLRIPPRSHHIVRRDWLVDALEDTIPRHKLTLISAPAGYGKTTLLADWARSTSLPVAWLSLGEEDNDIERFFRYLLTAWDDALPGVVDSPLGVLLGALMPDREAVLTAFVNVASHLPGQIVFALDDYHLIDDNAIHESMAFLLDHLPPSVHIVLAGRGEPPLPLARYRARREMAELDAEDLRFRVEELDRFLNHEMGLDLDSEAIASLHTQLEGWIAGTQMVALTLRRNPQPNVDRLVSGRHRFIADYLAQDVLSQQPDDRREFLLRTSILDRLSAPLCDAVTGNANGQPMLETLERENVFLFPLDDNREWYRYHRLFADFLRDELRRHFPDEVAGLHYRASVWYLEQDLPEPAFDHALTGADLNLMIRVCERYIFVLLHAGEFKLLQRWLNALPAAWYAAYPVFGLAQAGLLAFSGEIDACLRRVDDVEHQLVSAEMADIRSQLARVTAIRCFVACIQNDVERAESLAIRALQDLRSDDLSFRVDIYHALGDTYRRNGRWEEAKAAYRTVLNHAESPTFPILSPHVFGALADLDLRQGRLQDAAGFWYRALAAIQEPESWGRVPLPIIGWVYVRLGELLYEWNELVDAWHHVSRGLERAELSGDTRTLVVGYLLAGRIHLTNGDIAAAASYLEDARPHVTGTPPSEWTSRFERLQLELWLTQDRLRAAVNWSDRMQSDETIQQRPESEIAQMATARVLIVKGDAPSVGLALELLAPLVQSARVEGRVGIQIEAMALQALAYWRRGERSDALTSLEQTLRLAEPEGYLRLFADLGQSMARMLQEAHSRGMMPRYVASLLAACGSPASDEPALPEPLTDREQETLSLIAAGLTNAEIAERLFISPETVKKHAGNIYSKLGTRTRTEAVARARALGLLD